MSRSLILTSAFVLISIASFGQWSQNGAADKLRTEDAVLIGGTFTSPNRLRVYSPIASLQPSSLYGFPEGVVIDGNFGHSVLRMGSGSDYWFFNSIYNSNNDLDLAIGRVNSADGSDVTRMWLDQNGRVGIGTTAPMEKFHVNGGFMYLKDGVASGNNQELNTGIRFANYHNDNYAEMVAYRGLNVNQTGFQFNTNAGGNFQRTMTLINGTTFVGDYDSFIANGGTNVTGYKLQVEGKIRTEEVRIYGIEGWSDFVFARDYHLRPLSEVASYIQLNGHLPEVPSETEVLAEGYEVGEMDATLLQKIEELTLYMIEQNSQLKAQNAAMEAMQAEIATLRSQVEKGE